MAFLSVDIVTRNKSWRFLKVRVVQKDALLYALCSDAVPGLQWRRKQIRWLRCKSSKLFTSDARRPFRWGSRGPLFCHRGPPIRRTNNHCGAALRRRGGFHSVPRTIGLPPLPRCKTEERSVSQGKCHRSTRRFAEETLEANRAWDVELSKHEEAIF